jgi:hypothetical protein
MKVRIFEFNKTFFHNKNLITMRTLLRATFDVEASNKAIIDGSLSKVFNSIMERIQPEASYFLANDGCRSCMMVFDLKDPSDIPVIAETFFHNLNAKVDFSPVMNAEDLKKGLQKWQESSQYITEKLQKSQTN